jgi:hypothetical protein
MTSSVTHILESFDRLSEQERREALVELLRRAGTTEYAPLDDDTLSRIADEGFLEYDRREAADAQG